jgi:pseudouridine-5'-phosphate glycosidase
MIFRNRYRSIDMIAISDGIIQGLENHDRNTLSSRKTIIKIGQSDIDLQVAVEGNTYPSADASKGLHLPSGDRTDP